MDHLDAPKTMRVIHSIGDLVLIAGMLSADYYSEGIGTI
jgi:hypothetical protein